MPRIDLEIDELVLHGFPPGTGAGIGDSVRAELTRLLGTPDGAAALAAHGNRASFDAGSFRVAADLSPRLIGGQVARQLVAGARKP